MTNNTITIEIRSHYEVLEKLKDETIARNTKVVKLLAEYVIEYLRKSDTTNLINYSDISVYDLININSKISRFQSGMPYAIMRSIRGINLYKKGSFEYATNIICITMLQLLNNEEELIISPYEMVELMAKKYPEYNKKKFLFFQSSKNKCIAEGLLISKESLSIELNKILNEEFPKKTKEKDVA
tara:strand:- start:117 stop:668 length:552 start_codon:yes stop_codon:yes gene_type:complete